MKMLKLLRAVDELEEEQELTRTEKHYNYIVIQIAWSKFHEFRFPDSAVYYFSLSNDFTPES